MKKFISFIVALCMLVPILIPSNSVKAAENISTEFKEIKTQVQESYGQIDIVGNFENSINGDKHEFKIKDNNSVRIVEHFINGALESKAINNKKSGKIITINKEGKQIIQINPI